MAQTEATNAPFTTLVSGSFTAPGVSAPFQVGKTDFVFAIYGTFVGSLAIQANHNNGQGFVTLSSDPTNATGTPAVYTGPVMFAVFDPIIGAQYQVNCSALSSGTAFYEIQG